MEVFVTVGKTENNYAAMVDQLDGFVCTADSFEELKREVVSGIDFHLEGLREDEDPIPAPFEEEYELVYKWDIQTLLEYYKGVFSFSALERITGINQTQLGHYAAGRSNPRKKQLEKIEKAFNQLGNELSSVSL